MDATSGSRSGIPTPDHSPTRSISEASRPSSPEQLLENTGPRILMTGGVGYIGSHTAVELLQNNYRVVIVDNLSNSQRDVIERIRYLTKRRVDLHIVDITNVSELRRVFEPYSDIQAVLHLAALKAVGESNTIPLDYYDVNVGGTITLLQVMKEHNVNTMVFSSSAVVYGDPDVVLVSEKEPADLARNMNPYGRTKCIAEQIMRDFAISEPRFNCILLRFFNPTGAHPSGLIGEDPTAGPNNLMPYVTEVVQGRRPILKIFGGDYDTDDGTGVRDYIHVMDLASGHVAALKRLFEEQSRIQEKCPAYNLGSGKGYSVLEVIKTMSRVTKRKIPYEISARRKGDVGKVIADASLAERELGWKATRGMDEMCSSVWTWVRMWAEREREMMREERGEK